MFEDFSKVPVVSKDIFSRTTARSVKCASEKITTYLCIIISMKENALKKVLC